MKTSTKREATRVKPRSRAINPGAASQIGEAVAKNPVPWDNGKAFAKVPMGNTLTTMGLGAGGGRSVAKSGSQSCYGTNPSKATPAKDILREYGPDYKGSR